MTVAWIIAAVTCGATALMAYALARAADGPYPDTDRGAAVASFTVASTPHTATAQAAIDALPAVQAGAIRITLTEDAGWVAADVHTADLPRPRKVCRIAPTTAGPDRIVEAVIDRVRPQDEHAAIWRHSGLRCTVTDVYDDADAAPADNRDACVAWYTLAPHGASEQTCCIAVTCTPHGGVEACGYYRGGQGCDGREDLPIPDPEDDIAELLSDLILRDSVPA